MNTKRKKTGRKLLSFLLTLAMVVGLLPGMSLTALADGTTYNPASAYTDYDTLKTNNTEVTINEVADVKWYVIGYDSEAKTVTLLSKQAFPSKAFNSDEGKGHNYVGSDIEAYVKGLIGDGQPLAGIKDALADISGKVTGEPNDISGAVPYLLSETEAYVLDNTKKGTDEWWLRSPGPHSKKALRVEYGYIDENGNIVSSELGVRPALQLDLSKVTFDSTSKTFSVPTPTSYPLWVGDTRVTSANASNIDGNNKASYDDSTHTLTLNGYNLTVLNEDSAIEYGIKYTGSAPLTINLEGENAIEGYLQYDRYSGINYGIYITRDTEDIAADVTFTGEGSLSIKTRRNGITAYTNTHTDASVGNIVFSGSGEIDVVASGVEAIYTNYGTVTINSGTVTANGRNGIDTQKGVSITGGTVNAIGTDIYDSNSGIGIYTIDDISITGGTVNASGGETGISAGWFGDNDTITIDENVISVTISSSGKAISGKLLNKLSGKGWTNEAGTEGETPIESVNEAQEVSDTLKKIYFSSHEHNFTYTASGATITATCTADGCTLTDRKATLTIAPPAKTVYGDANSATATLTGLEAFNTATGNTVGETNIAYYAATKSGTTYTKSGNALDSAPTNAGDYVAEITVESKTAYVGYTIEKASSGTPTVTMSGYTYGGDVPSPSIGTYSGGGTVTYYYNTSDSNSGGTAWNNISGTSLDAGTYYMYAVISATDNYDSYTTGTASFTVSNATPATPGAPTKASATVNSITLTATDGYEYKCGDGNWQTSPTFTNLNMNTEYTFYQRVAACANHNVSETSQGATISTLNHVHGWSFSADGAILTATCANTDGGHVGSLTETLTINVPTLTYYGGSGSGNATLDGLQDFNTATGLNINASGITYYNATKSGTTYTKSGEALGSAPTNAGDYVAEITVNTGENDVTVSVGYTIAKAQADSLSAEQAREGVTINYAEETATAQNTFEVSLDGVNKSDSPANLGDIFNSTGTPTIYVRRAATDDKSFGEWVAVTLASRQDEPSGLTVENASSTTATDGKIKGTTTDMEYSSNGGTSWTSASADLTLVGAGTYLVRMKATVTAPSGKDCTSHSWKQGTGPFR